MILQVKHIFKAFVDNHVLDGVSLSLEFGQISMLMGANGSDKTTLIAFFYIRDTIPLYNFSLIEYANRAHSG